MPTTLAKGIVTGGSACIRDGVEKSGRLNSGAVHQQPDAAVAGIIQRKALRPA